MEAAVLDGPDLAAPADRVATYADLELVGPIHRCRPRPKWVRAKLSLDRRCYVVDDGANRVRIPAEAFRATHWPTGLGYWRRRSHERLRFAKAPKPLIVESPQGERSAEPGDWIILGEQGDLWPVAREKAAENYVVAADRSLRRSALVFTLMVLGSLAAVWLMWSVLGVSMDAIAAASAK